MNRAHTQHCYKLVREALTPRREIQQADQTQPMFLPTPGKRYQARQCRSNIDDLQTGRHCKVFRLPCGYSAALLRMRNVLQEIQFPVSSSAMNPGTLHILITPFITKNRWKQCKLNGSGVQPGGLDCKQRNNLMIEAVSKNFSSSQSSRVCFRVRPSECILSCLQTIVKVRYPAAENQNNCASQGLHHHPELPCGI